MYVFQYDYFGDRGYQNTSFNNVSMKDSGSCVRSCSNSLLSHLGNQNKLPSVLLNHTVPKHCRQGWSWALSWVQCGFCLSAILLTAAATTIPLLLDGASHPVEVESMGWVRKLIFIKAWPVNHQCFVIQNQSEFRVELHQAEGIYQMLSLQQLWNCDSAPPE